MRLTIANRALAGLPAPWPHCRASLPVDEHWHCQSSCFALHVKHAQDRNTRAHRHVDHILQTTNQL